MQSIRSDTVRRPSTATARSYHVTH